MRLGVKHDVVCGHKLQNECETDLFAQADSIRGRSGRLERVKVLKLPWACGGGGCARMEWMKRRLRGQNSNRGTLAGRRWVPLSKIFGFHDPTPPRMRAKARNPDANGRKSMSRALIHAY